MLSRRRNKLNLSLPRTVQEHENQEEEEAEEASSVAIEEELKRLGLTEPQKQRMQEWIKERNLVCYTVLLLLIAKLITYFLSIRRLAILGHSMIIPVPY